MTLPKDIFSILLCVFVAYATGTNATTILGMDIDKVANDAELIFEGEVILHETRQNSNTGIIHTYVTFTVHDVVKGDFSADTIELKFAGGTFMGQIVEVRGLKIPKEGENGIYFVESPTRDLLHPLIGWSQGHFIIEQELGERRVRTIDRQTVTDIQSVSSIPSVIKKPQAIVEGDGDVAAGVLVDSSSLSIDRALTVEELKNRILDLLEN